MALMEMERTATRGDVVLRAAEIVRRRGLTDGPSGMYVDGPVCYYGAVAAAMREMLGLEGYLAPHVVRAYLGISREDMIETWRWNDVPGRTAEQVADRLRADAPSFD